MERQLSTLSGHEPGYVIGHGMSERCVSCGQTVESLDFHGECWRCCVAGFRPAVWIVGFLLLAVVLALALG
jgi:hypothetical protein